MKAAILTAVNKPLEIHDFAWLTPRYGQVLVKVISSGICGAQIQEIRGEKGTHFPRLLGHEACVEVIDIGEGVTKVQLGDLCIAHWRKGEGIESANPRFMFSDCQHKTPTSGLITTFSTHSTISENRLTAVPRDTPVDLCALLGCGLSTALGTMENEANLKFGESVLIVGCGGLGLNLILAAKLRQAGMIVSMDIADKGEIACKTGAHYFVHSFEAINLFGNYSDFDVIIDTTGHAPTISEAIEFLAPSGRFIMVGQPRSGEDIYIPNARSMFDGTGKTILATQGGRFSPSQDIPRYVRMWQNGLLNIEGLVTHRFPLSEINTGLDLVRSGQAGRVMIDCADQ